MTKKRFHNNPKDLINETYNADEFPVVEKTMNALVMPLDMVQDVDALAYNRFYEDELSKIIGTMNKQ